MEIRKATIDDLALIETIESLCFLKNEAASIQAIEARIKTFSNNFWLLEKENQIIGFINGMVTNETTIKDEMFENTALHKTNGKWQSIFGVAVHPKYQKQGYAALLMNEVIKDTKQNGKQGCILTCKEKLIPYYSKFGYKNKGISKSEHGGEQWYDMTLEF